MAAPASFRVGRTTERSRRARQGELQVMKIAHVIFHAISFCAIVLVLSASASAQQKTKLGENAALRYWSAFAQMQDSGITDEQAKELNAILDGTAPYSDLKYRELAERNRPALETMAR